MRPRNSKIVIFGLGLGNRRKCVPEAPKSLFSGLSLGISENESQEFQNRNFRAWAWKSSKMHPRSSKIAIFGPGLGNRKKRVPGVPKSLFSGLGLEIAENASQEFPDRHFRVWVRKSLKMRPRSSKIAIFGPGLGNHRKCVPGAPKSLLSGFGFEKCVPGAPKIFGVPQAQAQK